MPLKGTIKLVRKWGNKTYRFQKVCPSYDAKKDAKFYREKYGYSVRLVKNGRDYFMYIAK